MRARISILLTSILVIAPGAIASADEAPPEAPTAPADRMVLPAKRGLVQAFLEVSLTKEAVGEPIAIAPDVWYGVSDVLTVGIVHSSRAATGFMGPVGDGLCLTGEEKGCGSFYGGGGVDVRYHVKDAPLGIAVDGGLFALDVDPFQLALKLGATARWRSGKLAVELAPSVLLGLTQREPEAMGTVAVASNKETFFLPVTALFGITDKLALAAQAGVVLPAENTGDTWVLPVSIGASVVATRKVFIDAAFSLPMIAGGSDLAGADFRTFTLGGGYAF